MILLVRLIDGSELVGDVQQNSDKLIIKQPLQVGYYYKSPTSLPMITMNRYMPFAKEDVFSFYIDHIVSTNEVKESVAYYYKEMIKELSALDNAIDEELGAKQEILDMDKEVAAAIIERAIKKPLLN